METSVQKKLARLPRTRPARRKRLPNHGSTVLSIWSDGWSSSMKTTRSCSRCAPLLPPRGIAAANDSPPSSRDRSAIGARATVLPPDAPSTGAHAQLRGTRQMMVIRVLDTVMIGERRSGISWLQPPRSSFDQRQLPAPQPWSARGQQRSIGHKVQASPDRRKQRKSLDTPPRAIDTACKPTTFGSLSEPQNAQAPQAKHLWGRRFFGCGGRI